MGFELQDSLGNVIVSGGYQCGRDMARLHIL